MTKYTEHQSEVDTLREALLNCETVALRRGDHYLCDCIDKDGEPYQSHRLDVLLKDAHTRTKS